MEGGVVELERMKLSAVEGAAAGVVLHKSIMLEPTPPVAKHCQTVGCRVPANSPPTRAQGNGQWLCVRG